MTRTSISGLVRKLVAVAAATLAGVPALASPGTLTVGVLENRELAWLETRLQPLADYLAGALPGHEVRLRVLGQAQIHSALARNELDFVFTNPAHYILLRERHALSGTIATVVRLTDGVAVDGMGGVVLVRADRPELSRLEDLERRRVVVAGKVFLAYVAPASALREAGVVLERIEVTELHRPHDEVVHAVLAGEFDAGFVRTDVLEQMERSGAIRPGSLRVLNSQALPGLPFALSTQLYPEWPMIALPHVDPQVARRFAAALLALEPDHPAARHAGIHGFTVPADYAPVERAMRDLRVPPFDHVPPVTWIEVWSSHRVAISMAGVALALLMLMLVVVIIGKRRVIRARQQSELAKSLLEREHLKLQTLLNTLPQAVWLRDPDGFYRGCNHRFQQLLGLPEQAIVGRRHADLGLGPELEFLDHDAVDGWAVREVAVHFGADGHEELLEVTLAPMRGADGTMLGVLGVGQDITERTRQRNELAAQRWRLDTLISGTRVGTWEWNAQTNECTVNERWADLIGYRLAELEPVSFATWERFVHPGDLELSNRLFERLFAREIEYYECEVRMRHKDGHWVWVLDRGAVASWTGDGKPLLVSGTHLDISARKRADQERQEMLERLQSIAAHVPGLIFQFCLQPDGRNYLPYASVGIRSIFGVAPEEVAETAAPLFDALHPEDRSRVQERMLESARNLAPWFDQFRVRHADGRLLWAEGSAAPVRQADRSIVWHGHIRDVSRLKAHEQELRQIAHYDTLTGTPNRRLLMERLQQAVARARRSGRHLGVCYLDIDGFKAVNDRCGHASGDQLLVEFSERLRGMLREDDTLARLGGDEFVLLLADVGDLAEAVARAEQMLAVAREPVVLGDRKLVVSASVGLTLYPPDDAEPDMLLRHADQAMYRAKNLGRDRLQVYDPEHDRANLRRRKDIDRLEQALANEEFTVFYQPKVDLGDGTVVGAEALLRWQHPEQGLLLPGSFLGQLEGTELELTLGDWVVERALCQLAAWNDAGLRQVVSVNISPAHLMVQDFAERMAAALERHPEVQPGQLELEIMENATLSNLDEASLLLARCRSFGLRISLDDFGTGYSSLSYLRRLPVDLLKIDQSFVRGMLRDPNDLGLVESVVRLAGAFNRPVIAEGVETLQHGAMLLRLGCRLAQGFGIGRPMPAQDFPAWIEDWRERKVWRHLANPFSGREDLFLDVVVRSHVEWAAAVLRRLHGQSIDALPGRQQCQFGHWYHGIGAADFGASRRFRELGALHERVHDVADELLAQVSSGDAAAVRAGVPAFEQARDRLLAELAALAAECAGADHPAREPASVAAH